VPEGLQLLLLSYQLPLWPCCGIWWWWGGMSAGRRRSVACLLAWAFLQARCPTASAAQATA
jgi:hypothetical protein